MESGENKSTTEKKTDRIEALLHELHSQEYQTFLEIQFDSLEVVYQSYPTTHNLPRLTPTQREAMQDIIDHHDLKITFEDTDSEYTTVSADHDTEPLVEDHMEIIEDIISDVYGVSFEDITLAFLSSRGPDTPEPLLWTDPEIK